MRETTQQFTSQFLVSLLCKSFTARVTQSMTKFLMQHFMCKRTKLNLLPQNSPLLVLGLARASSYFLNKIPKVLPAPQVNQGYLLSSNSKCTYFWPINYINNFSSLPDVFYIVIFAMLPQPVHSRGNAYLCVIIH